jgi:hypothetical protein
MTLKNLLHVKQNLGIHEKKTFVSDTFTNIVLLDKIIDDTSNSAFTVQKKKPK